jgi:hypothetical protein
MQQFKILGVALMAVFALSAFVSATASALPVILPEAAETWTGQSGPGTLETVKGTKIVCEEDTSEGTIEKSGKLGLFHIDFHKCTSSGAECMSLSDENELILVLGTYHVVNDKLNPNGVAFLFLLEPVHIECPLGGALSVVEGKVLCLVKPINTLAKHFEIVCEILNKKPNEVVYWGEKGEEINIAEGLKTTKNEKTTEVSGELTTSLILSTKELLIMA